MNSTARITAASLGVLALTALAAPATADTLRIAYLDPLSGAGAGTGERGLKEFQFQAAAINAKGGILGMQVEIVPYDNKVNPQETLVQAQKAIDAGIRILTQGNGSSVANALEDFVQKYNDRNPGKEVVYFNYAAVDPALTNAKCSYWHFRLDANSDIKMSALTNYMKGQPNIKKIYLINQDYSFGHAVRDAAVKMLKEKRPDIQIVGDEFVPLLKVTDFSPYIAKIKASGADSVITGNWDTDFSLLLKAAADAGLQVDWFTYYAGGAGGPTAIKQANSPDHVYAITEGVSNIPNKTSQDGERAYREKEGGLSIFYPRVVNEMTLLKQAIEAAKSADPAKFAPKLEGAKIELFDGGQGWMRAEDHQFFQPMYIASLGPIAAGEFDEEHTGWGWHVKGKIAAQDTVLPTTCKMERPS
jgi:branched-chain amino acid transport system substrate-binding protein